MTEGMRPALAAAVITMALAGAAAAADLPEAKTIPAPAAASPPIDFAFGGRVQSDYNFRGVTQSDHGPSLQGYGELQLFDNLLYAGVAAYQVDLPTRPAAEIDLTAGIRPKFGAFTVDLGVIGYVYPDERRLFDATGLPLTVGDTDYVELAGKVSYAATDSLTLGGNVFTSWDYLGSGASGTYASGTAKLALPFLEGLAVSGELGHFWLGRTSAQLGSLDLPDYVYWNAGLAYSYKNITLDLRYHDTNLSESECFVLTTDPGGIPSGRSNWCGAAFVATLSVDFTASQLGIFEPH